MFLKTKTEMTSLLRNICFICGQCRQKMNDELLKGSIIVPLSVCVYVLVKPLLPRIKLGNNVVVRSTDHHLYIIQSLPLTESDRWPLKLVW